MRKAEAVIVDLAQMSVLGNSASNSSRGLYGCHTRANGKRLVGWRGEMIEYRGLRNIVVMRLYMTTQSLDLDNMSDRKGRNM